MPVQDNAGFDPFQQFVVVPRTAVHNDLDSRIVGFCRSLRLALVLLGHREPKTARVFKPANVPIRERMIKASHPSDKGTSRLNSLASLASRSASRSRIVRFVTGSTASGAIPRADRVRSDVPSGAGAESSIPVCRTIRSSKSNKSRSSVRSPQWTDPSPAEPLFDILEDVEQGDRVKCRRQQGGGVQERDLVQAGRRPVRSRGTS